MTSNLIRRISRANHNDILTLLDAVLQRHSELFPDWETIAFSLCKSKDRNEQIDQIIKVFERLKDSP